jgi:hypothetical protein
MGAVSDQLFRDDDLRDMYCPDKAEIGWSDAQARAEQLKVLVDDAEAVLS